MNKIWHCGTFDVDTSKTQVMGIVNVTPDSFSDGGNFATTQAAVAHAYELISQGATIIDIGGESTRPGSVAPTIQEEIDRVVPVVKELSHCGVPLSVDTRHAAVARAAVEAGAHIINDIAGFRDPDMVQVAADCDAGLVVMHMQGTPETMQNDPHYDDVTRQVRTYLRSRGQELARFGIAQNRISVDPGFGFGKTYAHNLQLMVGMQRIVELGYPVLIGISRKTFIGTLLGLDVPIDRDDASAEIAADLVQRGAHIVRVHNVERTVEELRALPKARHEAYVALGSNIENKMKNLKNALANIAQIPCTDITLCSKVYESEPAYKTDQETFANAVVKVETKLSAFAFFAEIQAIEHIMGRVKYVENGPRNIDLDLLTFDNMSIDMPNLKVPHPRLQERDFVVTPLLEMSPAFTYGGEKLTRSHVSYGKVVGELGLIASPKLSGSSKQKHKASVAEKQELVDEEKLRTLQERLHLTVATVTVGIVLSLVALFIASASLWWVTTPKYAVERAVSSENPDMNWFERQGVRFNLLRSASTSDGSSATIVYQPNSAQQATRYQLLRQSDGGWKVKTAEEDTGK